MACISSCNICGGHVLNGTTCTSCKIAIADEAIAGRPIDRDTIKGIVNKKNTERNDIERKMTANNMAKGVCVSEALLDFKPPYPEVEQRY